LPLGGKGSISGKFDGKIAVNPIMQCDNTTPIMRQVCRESKKGRLVTGNVLFLFVIIATLMIASTMVAGAHAAPTRKVQGHGEGTFTCGDGTVHASSELNFDAQPIPKAPGPSQKLFGSWRIVSEVDNGFGSVTGNIYGGKVTKAGFTLLSTISRSGLGICDDDPSPSKGTITGQCGLDVKIDLQFETGAHGSFTGNVVCF